MYFDVVMELLQNFVLCLASFDVFRAISLTLGLLVFCLLSVLETDESPELGGLPPSKSKLSLWVFSNTKLFLLFIFFFFEGNFGDFSSSVFYLSSNFKNDIFIVIRNIE